MEPSPATQSPNLPVAKEAKPKHPGGRPTKYKPEYAKDIVAFFTVPPYKREVIEEREEYHKDGELKSRSHKYRYAPTQMPTLFRFAEKIGVSRQTLHTWADEHPEFLDAFTRAKEMQKEWLIANGLGGTAPPQSFVFVAKNITDMRDKVEQETTHMHQVFFVPKEIAEKHKLQLPEQERPVAPTPLPAEDVQVIEPEPAAPVEEPEVITATV